MVSLVVWADSGNFRARRDSSAAGGGSGLPFPLEGGPQKHKSWSHRGGGTPGRTGHMRETRRLVVAISLSGSAVSFSLTERKLTGF